MPPTLRDNESVAAAELRWVKRILAALALASKNNTLIIPRKYLDRISDTSERQAIFEDRDSRGNIVLRFGSKHSAVYPVESETAWTTKTQPAPQNVVVDPLSTTPPPSPPASTTSFPDLPPQAIPPKSPAAVAALERRLQKQHLANQIIARQLRDEREKRLSLESLIENLPPELTPQGMTPFPVATPATTPRTPRKS